MNWDKIKEFFTSLTLEKVLPGLLILVVGVIIVKLILRLVNRALDRSHLDKTAFTIVKAVIKVGLYLLVILIAAGSLGIDVTSLIALLSVVSLAVSLAVQKELEFFTELAAFSPRNAKAALSEEMAVFLPDWENSPLDFYTSYAERISHAAEKGYGIFAKYHVFSFGADGLQPVKHPDPQSLSQLSGYERESGIVLRNTEALLKGGTPSNLLLYGDAGTGKSSTIKAVANELKDKGLRLIEVKKSQLFRLPALLELLSENPLKFIIFIDDLSFSSNDEHFAALKATLEGSVAVCAKNTVIYATSNRRHLVKESMGERSGDDLHLNDSLQELMSLSARFGMTITFQKPDKEGYLSIVKHLAEEYGLDMPEEELFINAEAFAIRQNGRSPRTAKHFVETQLAKL